MMKNRKTICCVVLALLCGVAAVVYFCGSDSPKPVVKKVEKQTRRVNKNKRSTAAKSVRSDKSFVIPVKGRPGAYRIELPKDEESLLTDAYRKLLEELRAVADPLDRQRLLALVRRMQDSDEWPDGIPSILHMAAIEALEELGADGAAELSGYLESGDAEVREEAMDAIVDAVDDETMSDMEKSEMIKQFARFLKDDDALDSLFDIIDMDMRNSVQADTIKDVLENGTPEARKKLLEETIPEVIDVEDALGPEEAKVAVDEWLKENPDDEDDAEEYAGTPEDADDKEGDEEDTVEDADEEEKVGLPDQMNVKK